MGLAIVPTPLFNGKKPNTVLCTVVGNDTIYEASTNNYIPKYYINFPNNQQKKNNFQKLNEKYLEYKGTNKDMGDINSEALDFIMNPEYVRAIDFVHEFDKYLLFIYSYGVKKRYLTLYNKETNQCVTRKINALWNMYQNRFFQGNEEYIYLISSDPETLFEKEPNLSIPADHIPKTGDEANPIVFKIPLKQLISEIL